MSAEQAGTKQTRDAESGQGLRVNGLSLPDEGTQLRTLFEAAVKVPRTRSRVFLASITPETLNLNHHDYMPEPKPESKTILTIQTYCKASVRRIQYGLFPKNMIWLCLELKLKPSVKAFLKLIFFFSHMGGTLPYTESAILCHLVPKYYCSCSESKKGSKTQTHPNKRLTC